MDSVRPSTASLCSRSGGGDFLRTISGFPQPELARAARLSKNEERTTPMQREHALAPILIRFGLLEFGTELVAADDKSLVALLGASPGASPTNSGRWHASG